MNFEKITARLHQELSTDVNVSQLMKGLDLLHASGVLMLLKNMFRTKLQIHGEHPQEMMALQGAYNAGSNDALDLLINFKELYLEASRVPSQPAPTFGAFETNIKNGFLTEEETNAIKRGERPNYDKYIGTNKPPSGNKPVSAG